MEVEPVAAMFRDLGADTLLLELRNHGGSEARPFTFGLHEKQDVLAAVAYLRARPGGIPGPLILFGVSMGGVAVARAAPEIPELAGLVLDAPMTDLAGTLHRQLGRIEWQGRQGLGLPDFYVSLVALSIELWSGFDLDEVRPIDQLAALPATLPVLCIGAGRDVRVPPPVVREAFAALRSPAPLKQLWIAAEARHGHVWSTHPVQYRQHLEALFGRVVERDR
jgi:alpha-beta hydrolase superfamily lysophospholipase